MTQRTELTGHEQNVGFELARMCNDAHREYLGVVAQMETPESIRLKRTTIVAPEGAHAGFKYLEEHFPETAVQTPTDERDRAALRMIRESSLSQYRMLLFAAGELLGQSSPNVDNSELLSSKQLV